MREVLFAYWLLNTCCDLPPRHELIMHYFLSKSTHLHVGSRNAHKVLFTFQINASAVLKPGSCRQKKVKEEVDDKKAEHRDDAVEAMTRVPFQRARSAISQSERLW